MQAEKQDEADTDPNVENKVNATSDTAVVVIGRRPQLGGPRTETTCWDDVRLPSLPARLKGRSARSRRDGHGSSWSRRLPTWFSTGRKGPAQVAGRGQMIYRFISTSTPGRRSLLISTSGSLTRRRSSIVTSGSRTPLPTVTSGVRVQFSPHSGPTQFRSHTSAALAGSERRTEPVIAAATAKMWAFRISKSP
jgi:hypothetical protein